MTVFDWTALGLALVVVIATAVYAVAAGLRAWRSFRRFRCRLVDSIDAVTQRVAGMERHLDEAGAAAARLNAANAQLQSSLATARVLASAFAEFRAVLSLVTGVVPLR